MIRFAMKRMMNGQEGLSMVETAIAVAILGIIAVAFLSGLGTASMALVVADEKSTAENIARSEMEHAKNKIYVHGATSYAAEPIPGGDDYTGYSVTISAQALNNPDDGIQKITVTVSRNSSAVASMEGYKVNR